MLCWLVGKVDCFQLPGLDAWFNSNDHLPPHLHVEKPGAWEVKVSFLRDSTEMIETLWSKRKGPTKANLKMIATAVEAHRDALLGEWEDKVNVKTPGSER